MSERPTTEGERLVIALGYDLDGFWRDIETASEAGLREALAILETPSDPPMPDYQESRANGGAAQIRKQLASRGLEAT